MQLLFVNGRGIVGVEVRIKTTSANAEKNVDLLGYGRPTHTKVFSRTGLRSMDQLPRNNTILFFKSDHKNL